MTTELGQIIAFNSQRLTADILLANGLIYKDIPFATNLSVVTAPILPETENLKDPLNDAKGNLAYLTKIVKNGSFVLIGKFSDYKIMILQVLRDDLTILGYESAKANKLGHNDSILSLISEGDLLLRAIGTYYPNEGENPSSYEGYTRQSGSWILLKNSGDLLISNKDSSGAILLTNLGGVSLTGTKYTILGNKSSIKELESGSLEISHNSASNAILFDNDNLRMHTKYGYLNFENNSSTLKFPNIYVSGDNLFKSLYSITESFTNENINGNSIICNVTNKSLTVYETYNIKSAVYKSVTDNITLSSTKDLFEIDLTKPTSSYNPVFNIILKDTKISLKNNDIKIQSNPNSYTSVTDNIDIKTKEVNIKAKKVNIEVEGNVLTIDSTGVSIKPKTMVTIGNAPTMFVACAAAPGQGPVSWGQLTLTSKLKVSI